MAVMQDIEKVRHWAVEQMCGVAAIKTAPAATKSEVLKFLALHAFFAVDKTAPGKVKSCFPCMREMSPFCPVLCNADSWPANTPLLCFDVCVDH